MITDQDVTKLKKTFLTHAEFKKYVKILASKKDLQAFATKKELHILEEKVDGLVYEVGDLKVEFGEMKETLDLVNNKINRFLGNIDNLQTESNVCTVVQRRHTEQIEGPARHTSFILPA
ncbi:MAG: hypothetical protein JWM39_486 [Parcubacteria group bacterium]|nr:hypothetical protein [Parcubacteria group bacterium]